MKSMAGKLTNKETKEELTFAILPNEYVLNRTFHFEVEPCLGEAHPSVSFQSGGASSLQVSLFYDKDVEPSADPAKVKKFLDGLNQIHTEKRSPAAVQFTLGTFSFTGYLTQFTFHPTRFTTDGQITKLRLDLNLISTGEDEHGK